MSIIIKKNETKTNGKQHLIPFTIPLTRGDYPYHTTNIKLISVAKGPWRQKASNKTITLYTNNNTTLNIGLLRKTEGRTSQLILTIHMGQTAKRETQHHMRKAYSNRRNIHSSNKKWINQSQLTEDPLSPFFLQ